MRVKTELEIDLATWLHMQKSDADVVGWIKAQQEQAAAEFGIKIAQLVPWEVDQDKSTPRYMVAKMIDKPFPMLTPPVERCKIEIVFFTTETWERFLLRIHSDHVLREKAWPIIQELLK